MLLLGPVSPSAAWGSVICGCESAVPVQFLAGDAPLLVYLAQLPRNTSMWKAQVVYRMNRLFLQGAVCSVSPVAGRNGVIPASGRNFCLQIT